MRKYFIGGREVTKQDWRDTYERFPNASVILRTDKLAEPYHPPIPSTDEASVITPERAKEIHSRTRLQSSPAISS